jgi:hypothetical protein
MSSLDHKVAAKSKRIKLEEKTKYLIRLYKGGASDTNQGVPFNIAMSEIMQEFPQIAFRVEELDCSHLKALGWTVTQFVDWLTEPEVKMHFIIGHVHQGLILCGGSSLPWKMEELYKELERLREHDGFPTGKEVLCPMLTQDKFEYLRPMLQAGMANPSLRIPLSEEDDDFECYREAIEELDHYYLLLLLLY